MLEGIEKLRRMREKVESELVHVPRGDVIQNVFRAAYQSARMNSLGKKPRYTDSKEAVLKACIDAFKKTHPEFEPEYDKQFFHEKKR